MSFEGELAVQLHKESAALRSELAKWTTPLRRHACHCAECFDDRYATLDNLGSLMAERRAIIETRMGAA